MIKHRGTVSENQLLSIFRRINKKADACITFQEFVSFLCTVSMNPEKTLKKLPANSLDTRGSSKKPLISPIVRHLENERRSRSPLMKEISALSAKNLLKEAKNLSKRRVSPVRLSTSKTRAHSPHSRSPIKPTPTLSAKKSSLAVKQPSSLLSQQVRTRVSPQTERSEQSRSTAFERRPTYQAPKRERESRSSHRSSRSRDNPLARNIGPTTSIVEDSSPGRRDYGAPSYLEQRRAEFKSQRNDSKPQLTPNAPDFTPSRFDVVEESDRKASMTEPTTKQVIRSLKYDETLSAYQGRSTTGRIVDPSLGVSLHEKRFSRGYDSGRKEDTPAAEGREYRRSSRVEDQTQEIPRRRDQDTSKLRLETVSPITEPSGRVFEQKPSDSDARMRASSDMVEHVSPSLLQLTPSNLVDSLEIETPSQPLSRTQMREKNARIPVSSIRKKSEEGHLLSGYHTGLSELSFSERKPDEMMAETPKFDSGIHPIDTGARPTRRAEQVGTEPVKPSTIEILCMIMKKIIVFYERIEELKNQIHSDRDFSLANHFSSFDFENKGYLTLVEFTQLFNSFGVNIGRGEIVEYLKLILKRSSIRPESRLIEADLAKCFAPLNAEGKLLMYSSTSSRSDRQPKYEVKPTISAKLDEIVQLQVKLHCELIKEIKSIDPSVLPKLFKLISQNLPVATWEHIIVFLRTNDVKFFENDVIFIFREFNSRSPKELNEAEFVSFFRQYATAGL